METMNGNRFTVKGVISSDIILNIVDCICSFEEVLCTGLSHRLVRVLDLLITCLALSFH